MDRTLGQMVKAKLYRQNLTQKHKHSQKEEKGKIYIYHCSQCPPPQFGMVRCLFRYSTDAGLTVEISSAAPEAAGRDFPFSSLFAQLLGSGLDLDPPLQVGCLRASVLRSDRIELK